MLKDSKVKAKIFCMGGGIPKDVTKLYRYATRLNECNIQIWESDYGMTYVCYSGRIILKSVTSFFKILYSRTREVFIFRTYEDAKEGYKIYEFYDNELEPFIEKELSSFEQFEEISRYNLILLSRHSKKSVIYDYDRGEILMETENPILWLDKIGVFLTEQDKKYQMIMPRIEQSNGNVKVILKKETKGKLESKPVNECGSQLIGNFLINFEGEGKVSFIYEFREVEEPHWLPEPYKYLVTDDNGEIGMLSIVKGKHHILFIGHKYNTIKPLLYPVMSDYMIGISNYYESVGIFKYVRYAEGVIETIAEYPGNDIKLLDPVLDIANSCIKIPVKVLKTQEKGLNEFIEN